MPALFTYEAAPGVPPVSVLKLSGEHPPSDGLPGAHSHDFLALAYFERDGGALRSGERSWDVKAGDVFVIAPGEVHDASGLAEAEGWVIFFAVEVLGSRSAGSFLSWRAHPLLFPFVRGSPSGGVVGSAQHLSVPLQDRPSWSARLSVLDLELRERRDGYREAALAHLTLVLVEVARLARDVVGELKLKDEPLLAKVFGFVETHYREPISLKDVARAVNLSSGYLTTLVRRKTGRTVLEWIVERRMAEARKLLVESDLSVEEVGQRAGYDDPGYFVRSFRRAHGTTPLGWRGAGRS